MDTPPKHVEAEEVEQELVFFPQGEEESERGRMLDEMIKQVVHCMLVRCLSDGCVEQRGQGAVLWILSVAVTPLPL